MKHVTTQVRKRRSTVSAVPRSKLPIQILHFAAILLYLSLTDPRNVFCQCWVTDPYNDVTPPISCGFLSRPSSYSWLSFQKETNLHKHMIFSRPQVFSSAWLSSMRCTALKASATKTQLAVLNLPTPLRWKRIALFC